MNGLEGSLVQVLRMRARCAHLDRAVLGLRRLEHPRGGERADGPLGSPRRGEARRRAEAGATPRRAGRALGAARDRDRRARPGARRRSGPRLAGPARRRARDRQEHAGRHGARQHRGRRATRSSTSRARSRRRRSGRRAERLGEAALSVPMLAEPSLESVLAALESERPAACVIDSVQTLAIPDSAPGQASARSERRPRRCWRRRSGST